MAYCTFYCHLLKCIVIHKAKRIAFHFNGTPSALSQSMTVHLLLVHNKKQMLIHLCIVLCSLEI